MRVLPNFNDSSFLKTLMSTKINGSLVFSKLVRTYFFTRECLFLQERVSILQERVLLLLMKFVPRLCTTTLVLSSSIQTHRASAKYRSKSHLSKSLSVTLESLARSPAILSARPKACSASEYLKYYHRKT